MAEVPAETDDPGRLVFDLGTQFPKQYVVIELPSWACGTITINNYSYYYYLRTISLEVSFPDGFLKGDTGPIAMHRGVMRTIELIDGARFSFYWVQDKNDLGHQDGKISLILRRHCPTDGCKKLCDCS